MNIRNNGKIIGFSVLGIFLMVVLVNEIRRDRLKQRRIIHRATTIGITKGCSRGVRNVMYTLKYEFEYKEQFYTGTVNYDGSSKGSICNNVHFLVVFDSLNPGNSELYLDSIR